MVTSLEKGGWVLLQVQQTKVVAQELLQVLMDTWTPYGPSLTFNREVINGLPVSGAAKEQQD